MSRSESIPNDDTRQPRVIIIGGGFAGLAAARALRRAPVEVVLVDRRNHHLFQPLLYQVATAALSPADIARSIRAILKQQKNCRVVLGEATAVELETRTVTIDGRALTYDWLVLAAGAAHSYFGNDEWYEYAPGLKSVEDAVEIRRRILLAFENAEYEAAEARRRAALTFAVVGGGPTGVELAGAIKEIAARSIPRDFRNIDTRTTRVILFEAGGALLPAMPEPLCTRAKRDLEAMGVEVRLNAMVTDVGPGRLVINDEEEIAVRNTFWAAGVKAAAIAETCAVETDKAGRIVVASDLSIPGHPEVFVVGDLAHALSADSGEPVPGVAPAAMQMGKFVGRLIAEDPTTVRSAEERRAFEYRDKGTLATIGKARAVAAIGRLRFAGLTAWVLWAVVHIAFLVGFRNRAVVLLSWLWNWVVSARDARLITGDARLEIEKLRGAESPPSGQRVGA